jgi:hypothetical protein
VPRVRPRPFPLPFAAGTAVNCSAVCVAAIHGAHLAAIEVGGLSAGVQDLGARSVPAREGGRPQVSPTDRYLLHSFHLPLVVCVH